MATAKENSVKNLQNLYSVVIALALARAIQTIVGEIGGTINPQWAELLPMVFALLATLIPFYHGALRHLDVSYLENPADSLRKGSLLADFVVLFVEGCLFIAAASFIDNRIAFAWSMITILVFDTVWAFLAHLAFRHKNAVKAEPTWAIINLVTTILLIVFTLTVKDTPCESIAMLIGLPAILFARSAFDYWRSWEFYFPGETPAFAS